MRLWYETFLEKHGNLLGPSQGVSVTVYVANTMTLATIYENDGTTPKPNPLTSDANGYVEAKMHQGSYDIVATRDGEEVHRWSGIVFEGFDGSDVVITGGTLSGVEITDSTIDSTAIGQTTPASGSFTDIEYSGEINGGGA